MTSFGIRRALFPPLSFLVCCVLLVPSTRAADVTVGFVATIDYVEDGTCICLDHDALMGLEIYGYYTYDNATLDSNPASGVGLYNHSAAPHGIRVYVGDDVFDTDPSSVNFVVYVRDAPTSGATDLNWATSVNNLADPFYFLPNTPTEQIGVWLDGDQDAVASDQIPAGPQNLADWLSARVAILGPNFEYSIYATITWLGEGAPTSVPSPGWTPALLSLGPNPFSSETTLRFSMTAPGPTTLRIYDVAGHLVRTLDARNAEVGREYAIPWDARDDRGSMLPTGVYFAKLATRDGNVTRKVSILK